MLKGENYSSQLYENWSNRLAINTFLGGKCGIIENFDNELAVTVAGSNVSIDSGVVIIKGGIIRNTTSTTLSVQLEANKYHSVVVEVDLNSFLLLTYYFFSFNNFSIKLILMLPHWYS